MSACDLLSSPQTVCGSGEAPLCGVAAFLLSPAGTRTRRGELFTTMPATEPAENLPPTRLLLVRHGQAVVNVTHVMGGMKGDTGLTDFGREQARRLRERFANDVASGKLHADVLVASTLPRARETAEIIAPALGLPIVFDDDLQEFRVGDDADGLSRAEYIHRYGWVDIAAEPFTPSDPGGESWARFMLRVAETLERIACEYAGKTVVVVCHGGIIDGSLVHFFGMNAHAVPPARLFTRNTSLTLWTHVHGDDKPRWRLDFYNDAHHLDGLVAEAVVEQPDDSEPTEPIVPTETE